MAQRNGAFRVVLKMHIHPGMEEEFEEVWLKVGSAITSHPANLGQWLSKDSEEENVYWVMSEWIDERRFREFEQSDEHVAHRTKLHPYRSSGSMMTMHVVYAMRGAGLADS